MTARETLRLYDAFAATYDHAFESDPVRAAYDQLAWETATAVLPAPPAVVVDAGCGTGRWVSRLLERGHQVIGLEPAPGMQEILHRRFFGRADVELLAHDFDDAPIAQGSAAAAMAIGSLQYAADPAASLRRIVSWVRPGGLVCVHVDSLLGVVLELIRLGRVEEAVQRAQDGWGVFSLGTERARLRLFDRNTLRDALAASGLARIEVRGLLIGASALGRTECAARLEADGLEEERHLMAIPAIADAGKHLIGWGWRPLA